VGRSIGVNQSGELINTEYEQFNNVRTFDKQLQFCLLTQPLFIDVIDHIGEKLSFA
jgi:hypothetical protein